MLIALHGKGFETPLIDWPAPRGLPMSVPTLCMGDRDPTHDFGELAIVPRPQEQMPVVGHQTVRGNPDARSLVSLVENLFKG